MLLSAAVLALALAAEPKAPLADDAKVHAAVAERVKVLVAALSARDPKALVALFDTSGPTLLGTDVAEVCHDVACIEKQSKDAFALVDASKYGEPKPLSIHSAGGLATAYFDVTAEVTTGKEKKSQVQRVATTWRLSGSDWKLLQLLRSVPTVSRSAREMLKENELK